MLGDRAHDATLVNDVPVIGSVILHAGDWIRLARTGHWSDFLATRTAKMKTRHKIPAVFSIYMVDVLCFAPGVRYPLMATISP